MSVHVRRIVRMHAVLGHVSCLHVWLYERLPALHMLVIFVFILQAVQHSTYFHKLASLVQGHAQVVKL